MSRTTRPTRTLSARPHLDQLRRQARELLDAFLADDPAAVSEVHAHYRDARRDTFALHDAQLVIARACGFDSWPRLKTHVDGLTAKRLIEAVRANDVERTAAILKARPDLADMQWSYGDERRALHYAVMNGAPAMVRLLLQHGADAGAGVHPHRDATTARMMAVDRELPEIVALIDEETSRRQTAVRAASADAETRAPQATIEPALRAAVARGDVAWLRHRHADRPLENTIDWGEGGLLTLAATHGQIDVLSFLLDCGFDPDERIRWSEGPDAAYSQGYPLWHCAATGKRELAELLLQRGANPNVHVDSSGSPVYSAYSHRQWAMVELLKQRGGIVTPDIVGVYRETALAAELLNDSAGRSLPDAAIPPDRSLEDYLLEFALSGGAAEIVRMVLPRIDWPRDDPRWFRMLGRGLDFWNHIPWLRAANKDFDRASYVTGFRLLVDRCDPNVTGGFGRTALHEAAATGDHITDAEAALLAGILLDAGARTTGRDELLESTPLAWACRWGRAPVVRVLLEHGADPVEADAPRWARPRAWAARMNHEHVAAVLLEFGA